MTKTLTQLSEYLHSVERLEPDLVCVDRDAALTSIAISMKRIADALNIDVIKVEPDTNETTG